MFLSFVIVFCIASVHCAPSAISSPTLERSLPSIELEPELPSMDCKDPPFAESCRVVEKCGVYTMWIGGILREVYCDVIGNMRFIVVQRRGNFGEPEDYFYKGWHDYKYGFGDPRRSFWIGNEALHNLTRKYKELHIAMEDFQVRKAYLVVNGFDISSEYGGYSMYMSSVFNDPQEMGYSFWVHRGNQFSTKDKDHDNMPNIDCAKRCQGGWWYQTSLLCASANLNGLYFQGQNNSRKDGVYYKAFRGEESLKSTEMRIRVK